MSQTHFDSTFLKEDKKYLTNGYNFIRADHPSRPKREGVCILYRETPDVHIVNSPRFNECVLYEVTI